MFYREVHGLQTKIQRDKNMKRVKTKWQNGQDKMMKRVKALPIGLLRGFAIGLCPSKVKWKRNPFHLFVFFSSHLYPWPFLSRPFLSWPSVSHLFVSFWLDPFCLFICSSFCLYILSFFNLTLFVLTLLIMTLFILTLFNFILSFTLHPSVFALGALPNKSPFPWY